MKSFRWKIDDKPVTPTRPDDLIVHLLSELEPWKQYVVYIETYTLALSKKSGRSRLMYFRTQPDGKSLGQGGVMRRAIGVNASSIKRLTRLNLRWLIRKGAWNVLSVFEVPDKFTCRWVFQLPEFSAKLSLLGVSVAPF